MPFRFTIAVAAAAVICTVSLSAQRPRGGHPDLQGLWTNGTATPLQRPTEFADKPSLSEAEAAAYEKSGIERLVKTLEQFDQASVTTAADLNDIYLETHTLTLAAGRRTSLVIDPSNGRLPALLAEAKQRADARPKHNYDDPEGLDLDERCLLETAFGSSNAAPPMVPNPFGQNFYQIVQTPQHVMIYTEVVHDARIIRIGGQHLPPEVKLWLGDSVGRWEGDTLVVDTTNFTPKSHFRNSGERLHVVERFTRTDATTIRYLATVEDPDTWSLPWTADIPFKATDKAVLEYACHEANYSMTNSLRGARFQERAKK